MQLYKWVQTDEGSRELQIECSHTGHVLALYVVTRGDFVIVGGLHYLLFLCYASVQDRCNNFPGDHAQLDAFSALSGICGGYLMYQCYSMHLQISVLLLPCEWQAMQECQFLEASLCVC